MRLVYLLVLIICEMYLSSRNLKVNCDNGVLKCGNLNDCSLYESTCKIQCNDGRLALFTLHVNDCEKQATSNCKSDGFEVVFGTITTRTNGVQILEFPRLIIRSFSVNLIEIQTMYSNAFSSDSFITLQKLLLKGVGPTLLSVRIFKDLPLNELLIQSKTILNVPGNLLEPIRNTLTTLTLQQISVDQSFPLNGFFDAIIMAKLKNLTIKDINLSTTLVANSFQGLLAIISLDMENSKINNIPNGLFDTIANTIEFINLSRNNIKTITEVTFHKIFEINSFALIYLNNNNIQCSCELSHLLINYGQYFDIIQCIASPTEVLDCTTINTMETSNTFTYSSSMSTTTSIIITAEPPTIINNTTEISDANNYTTISTNTPMTTTTTIDFPYTDFTVKECPALHSSDDISPKTMKFKSKYQQLNITDLLNGEIIIELKNNSKNLVLLWYNINNNKNISMQYFDRKGLNCMNNLNERTTIYGLTMNSPYYFCLIDVSNSIVSPYNCISHYVKSGETTATANIWLYSNQKIATIFVILILIIISIMMGAVFGYFMVRKYPEILKGGKGVIIVKNHITMMQHVNLRRRMNANWQRTPELHRHLEKPPPYRRYSNVSEHFVSIYEPSGYITHDSLEAEMEKKKKLIPMDSNGSTISLDSTPDETAPRRNLATISRISEENPSHETCITDEPLYSSCD